MNETSEHERQMPSLVEFLGYAPDVYTYTPIGFDSATNQTTVLRQLQEPPTGDKQPEATEKGRITVSLADIDGGLDWLGRQTVRPDQAVNLARTSVNLAKVASFAKQSQTNPQAS